MSLIENYTKKYQEAQKGRMEYLEQLSNIGFELTTTDFQKSRDRFNELSNFTKELEANEKELQSDGKLICDYSTISVDEAKEVLPNVIKDFTGLDYRYESFKNKNSVIHYLRRIGTNDKINSYNDLLISENIILLSDKTLANDPYRFKLYFETIYKKLFFVTTMLTTNYPDNAVKSLVDFVNNYIDTKEKNPKLTWKKFYSAYVDKLTHGYDEDLLEEDNYEDAYLENDKEAKRRDKRRQADYFHKKKRESINQIQAQKKLELLPTKYQ